MEYRPFGSTGLSVSAVGFGCWEIAGTYGRIDEAQFRLAVARALDAGINCFDTAEAYGMGISERALGQALGSRRQDVLVVTKFGVGYPETPTRRDASRARITASIEKSLKNLGTDHVDVYLVHWPDPATPLEETMQALDDVVRQGKVRYIGCSNFAAWQMVEAQWTSRHHGLAAFVSCQNEYSLIVRDAERELVPAMQAYGLGLLPYFPLASGLLSGKYKRGQPIAQGLRFDLMPQFRDRFLTDANFATVEALETFARARGRTLVELAFGWLASRPTVASVIAGATRPEQVEENAAAVGRTLGAEDLAELERLAGRA